MASQNDVRRTQSTLDLETVLYAIRAQESRGNYRAVGVQTKYGTAKGAYQFLDRTWGEYAGYKTADQAPPEIQDQRARELMQGYFDKYKSWSAVIASWYGGGKAGEAVMRGDTGYLNRQQKSGPSIASYIRGVIQKGHAVNRQEGRIAGRSWQSPGTSKKAANAAGMSGGGDLTADDLLALFGGAPMDMSALLGGGAGSGRQAFTTPPFQPASEEDLRPAMEAAMTKSLGRKPKPAELQPIIDEWRQLERRAYEGGVSASRSSYSGGGGGQTITDVPNPTTLAETRTRERMGGESTAFDAASRVYSSFLDIISGGSSR